jgi:hypothetical protein
VKNLLTLQWNSYYHRDIRSIINDAIPISDFFAALLEEKMQYEVILLVI